MCESPLRLDARDGALYHVGTQSRKRTDVIEGRDAARRDDGKARHLGDVPVGIDVDPRLHAVTRDIRKDEVPVAEVRKMSDERVRRNPLPVAPAVHADLAIASRDVRDNVLGEQARRLRRELWVAHERRADGDALCTGVHQPAHGVHVTYAAARVDVYHTQGADVRDGPVVLLDRLRILAKRRGEVHESLATATGSVEYTSICERSPRLRRTTCPATRSMAGKRIMR